ncbi:MAG: TauD/TfdA family dioxygenase [Ilumatobacter sp.]|uniref:TauD/TfdA dioxygenase family protein n=1 Tax=Ilumatobacter sp. TaxID=1967498 RepID=UPI003C761F7D
MDITAASEHVGAIVSGVDLRDLDDSTVASIEQAWAEHGVLFFRDQHVSEDDHTAFAERFAEIDVNKFFTPVATHPQIAEVRKEADQIVNVGGGWHTDHSYDVEPARGSILVARDLPPSGGDTQFLSVGAAYDALSDGLKDTLSRLRAHHSNEHIFGKDAGYDEDDERFHNADAVGGATHPVVIRHPQTGRRLLYVNAAFTTHFVGWTREESKPLLDFLLGHIANGDFDYRFEWKPGSVAMWDNRSTWHWAHNDYHGQRRLMHRITVRGEVLEG